MKNPLQSFKRKFIFLPLICLSLFMCQKTQKNNNNNNNNNGGNNQNTACQVANFIEVGSSSTLTWIYGYKSDGTMDSVTWFGSSGIVATTRVGPYGTNTFNGAVVSAVNYSVNIFSQFPFVSNITLAGSSSTVRYNLNLKYDNMNRVVEADYSDASLQPLFQTLFTYDVNGNCTGVAYIQASGPRNQAIRAFAASKFDNHPAPYTLTQGAIFLHPLESIFGGSSLVAYDFDLATAHNPLEIILNQNNADGTVTVFRYEYTYDYNNSGYPTQRIETEYVNDVKQTSTIFHWTYAGPCAN